MLQQTRKTGWANKHFSPEVPATSIETPQKFFALAMPKNPP